MLFIHFLFNFSPTMDWLRLIQSQHIPTPFEGEWGVFFGAKGLMTYQEIGQIFKNLKFRGDV